MRKVLLGGTIGAIPGLLIAFVPLLLHDAGVLSSDQSQIGFIGVPILFVGVLVGTLHGAGEPARARKVALGVAAGLVGGMAIGLLATAVFAGLWLLTGPAAMIVGGSLAARSDDGRPSPDAGSDHDATTPDAERTPQV